MPWRALLDGDLKKQALRAIDDIERDLKPDVISGSSLSAGHSGLALFFTYRSMMEGQESAAHRADHHLDSALDSANDESSSALGLHTGLCGVAWTMRHVEQVLHGTDGADLTEDLDAAVVDTLRAKSWEWQLDLVYGLAGIGCYLLDHPDVGFADDMLSECCRFLTVAAEMDARGVRWRTHPQHMSEENAARYPEGVLDLGVAHGTPGVIGFLGRAYSERGISEARALRDGAASWLRGVCEEDPLTGLGYFAGARAKARSAWCYGNPGVAAALMTAFDGAGPGTVQDWALAMALEAARRPSAESGVVDATLCHGAAGLGHIYNRLSQVTGSVELAEAARFWFAKTLSMRQQGKGCGGYLNWWPEAAKWGTDAGFLVGASGIGLTLLAAVSDREPAWDRLLLLPRLG
ncbi:MAG: lanthionine synthetase C family protein [Acidobacteriota bacterium]|nr:lanthionine synthetase C family protein [Acidobacteriota bacterium]